MKSNIVSFDIEMQNALHSEDARELSRAQREFIQAYSPVKIVVGFCNDGEGFKPVLCFLKQFLYIFVRYRVLAVALGEEWHLLNHSSSVMNGKGQTEVGKHWSTQETKSLPTQF